MGAAGGFIFLTALVLLGFALWPVDPPYGTTPLDRLLLVAWWQSLAFLPLLFSTALVAWMRFTIGALNPLAVASPVLDFPTWYVRSTSLHSLLLLIAQLAFALTAGAAALPLVPLVTLGYVTGRAVMWAGGPGRTRWLAFGFATSLPPTAVLLLWAAWRVLTVQAALLADAS